MFISRLASRAEAATVTSRQSQPASPYELSINANSSSQTSVKNLAGSEPNNSVTALINANNSRSAMLAGSAQVDLLLLDPSPAWLNCIPCMPVLDSESP
jgi:hypothetical protein